MDALQHSSPFQVAGAPAGSFAGAPAGSFAGAPALSRSLLASVLALGLVTALAAAVFSLYGRRLRGSADERRAISRSRRALRWGLPLVYVTALGAMAGAGWLGLLDVVAVEIPGGTTAIGDAVSLVVGLAVPAVAPIGAYLGLFPAITALRDVEMSATTAVLRLARYGFGMVVLVAVLVAATTAATAGSESGLATVGGVMLVVVALLAASPWLVRLLQDARAPTDAERERLREICDEAGLDPESVRVVDTSGAKQAYAVLRGLPGRRHLFVSDYLLEELDDERLRTYLAVQAGRARLFHLEVKTLVGVGTLVLAGSLALGLVSLAGVSDTVAGFVVLAVGAGAIWAGQRLVYRADAYAADRTSRESVEETIRAFADLNDAPMEWGRLTALRQMEPPLVARIDRLRDRDVKE